MNIKGTLEGTVVVYGHDLKPGSTYLLGARTRLSDWHIISVFVPGRKLISSDDTLSNDQLKSSAEQDERVIALQKAYPSEVLPLSDVQRNVAWNNYESVRAGHPVLPSDGASRVPPMRRRVMWPLPPLIHPHLLRQTAEQPRQNPN